MFLFASPRFFFRMRDRSSSTNPVVGHLIRTRLGRRRPGTPDLHDAGDQVLRDYLPRLLASAPTIAASEELRLALPSGSAVARVAYVGEARLPLGTLIEFWTRRDAPDRPDAGLFLVGVQGSPLSGRGVLHGYSRDTLEPTRRPFDRPLALELLDHPLVMPFRRRVSEGRFLRIGDVVRELGP